MPYSPFDDSQEYHDSVGGRARPATHIPQHEGEPHSKCSGCPLRSKGCMEYPESVACVTPAKRVTQQLDAVYENPSNQPSQQYMSKLKKLQGRAGEGT